MCSGPPQFRAGLGFVPDAGRERITPDGAPVLISRNGNLSGQTTFDGRNKQPVLWHAATQKWKVNKSGQPSFLLVWAGKEAA